MHAYAPSGFELEINLQCAQIYYEYFALNVNVGHRKNINIMQPPWKDNHVG